MSKFRTVLTAGALVMCTAVITSQVVSQDAGKQPTPEELEMMEKWAAYSTPGEYHKILEQKKGNWNFAGKFWHDPNTPATESTGTSNFKMIMGGRYLADHTESTFEGMSFQGMGLTGYCNIKKKFQAVWLDNMGTGVSYAEGTCDPAGKVVTFSGEMADPTTGKYKWYKSVERYIDENSWTMEMYTKNNTGKEWKNMEITYTRGN